jgi:F420-dependent oxidoreductase-like protein
MSRLVLAFVAVLLPTLAAARPLRFGVQIPPEGATYEEIAATFKLVESLGYDTAWVNDHFIPPLGNRDAAQLEAWTLLAALAAETSRIRLGVLVSGNTYRHPAVLAKMAATVDHASGGRLNFGLGAGWEELEHRAYGFPFYTARERAARLAEALDLLTRLWTTDPASFQGKYYRLVDAPFAPPFVQKPYPPIVLGGQGKQWIMPIVARYADEWNVPIGVDPAGMRERLAWLGAECVRIGRSPCVREVSVFLPLVNMTEVPLAGPATRLAARFLAGERVAASVLAGSVASTIARIREYADAGATSVIITTRPGLNRDLMRRFAAEVIPAARGS